MPDPKKIEPGIIFDKVTPEGKPIPIVADDTKTATDEAKPAAPETPAEKALRLQNHLRQFRESIKGFTDDEIAAAAVELEKQVSPAQTE
ncbi:MAG: hypothetical protein ABSA41_12590 [Terriglobia bacterium]